MTENFTQRNLRHGNAQHDHGKEGGRSARIGDGIGNDHRKLKIHKIQKDRQQRGNGSDVENPGQERFYAGFCRDSICGSAFFNDADTCGIKQQIVDHAVDGNIDQRTAAENCGNERNAQKSHVAVHGQKVVHIAVFLFDPHDQRKQQACRQKQGINADRDKQRIQHVADGYGRFLFKGGAEDGCRIAYVDHQPGYVAGRLVAQLIFLKHDIADQNDDEHDAHLTDHDGDVHEYLQIEVISRFICAACNRADRQNPYFVIIAMNLQNGKSKLLQKQR